jgi:hypothetical protein
MAGYYANPNMYGGQMNNAYWWNWALANSMLASGSNGSKKDDVSMTIVKLENLDQIFAKDVEIEKKSFTPMGVKFPCGVVIPLPNPGKMDLAFTKRIDEIVAMPDNAITKDQVIKAMNARLAANYYQNDKCSPFSVDKDKILQQCHGWISNEEIISQIQTENRTTGYRRALAQSPPPDGNAPAQPGFNRQNATVI